MIADFLIEFVVPLGITFVGGVLVFELILWSFEPREDD